jgi:hypothetical protein
MGYKLVHFVSFFIFLAMFNTFVGAGAALRDGFGSDRMVRLRLRLRNTVLDILFFFSLFINTVLIRVLV